jgi:hypothetical protein
MSRPCSYLEIVMTEDTLTSIFLLLSELYLVLYPWNELHEHPVLDPQQMKYV